MNAAEALDLVLPDTIDLASTRLPIAWIHMLASCAVC